MFSNILWHRPILALMFAVAVNGCSQQHASPDGIVSLSPAITETLFRLELGSQLIGRSDYCEYPPEAQQLKPMGSSLSPNLEALALAKPRVIVYESSLGSDFHDLSKLGTNLALPWLTLDQIVNSIQQIGDEFNRRDQAQQLVQQLQNELSAKNQPNSPTLLLLLYSGNSWDSDWWFIRQNSIHGRLINAAGYRNAISEDVKGASVISVERLLQINPDYVIAISTDHDQPQKLESDFINWMSQLHDLQAVQSQHVGLITSTQMLSTGPGITHYVSTLREKIQSLDEH